MAEKTILLVEDTSADEELVLVALERSHLTNRVVVVRDGAEALDYLFGKGKHAGRNLSQVPAVIFLDLKLPKIDGLEVLRRIRADERTQLLPVVVLTSSTQQEDVISSLRLGANSYVHKPVDFDQFSAAVRQLGLYWLHVNVPPRGS